MADNFIRLERLVTEDRLRQSIAGSRGILIASESDKARVINSIPFRRLQQKAQVFPLDPNAAVRTRLTHSIEVSQIGRHIAQIIIEKNSDTHAGTYGKLAAFVNLVETACLLHDIGNPPFGHLGEAAVREWFKTNKSDYIDLVNFDGNPQGLRLMAFLEGNDGFGFNLTCSLILSTIKYPRSFSSKKSGKFGINESEMHIYTESCSKVGWEPGKKFPFMMLMDTADDIAYSLSDLEDGLEKNIIGIEDLKKEFGAEHFQSRGMDPFIFFKTNTINAATKAAADIFCESLEEILEGREEKLLEGTNIQQLITKINAYAAKKIYSHESAEQVELAGKSVIGGLLNHFGSLLELSEEKFKLLIEDSKIRKNGLDFEMRLFRRIQKSYVNSYIIGKSPEPLKRAQLLVDYISGMTDDFALESFQILQGIRIK